MSYELNIETESFEAYSSSDDTLEALDGELTDLEEEEQIRRGRRPVRPTGFRPRPGRPPRSPKRPPSRPKPPRSPVVVGRRIVREPAPCVCPAHGTEFVRWVQSSLNQVLGLNLAVSGVMDAPTRSALRRFQEQQGLPVDGIAGPETERALVSAKKKVASTEREFEISDITFPNNDGYPSREPEEEFSFSDFPSAVLKVLRRGLESVAVRLAVRSGIRDENKLSDLVFFSRYPARGGRLLKKGEPNFNALSREWLDIRDLLIRPIVARVFFTEYELHFNPGTCAFCIDANPKFSASEKVQRKRDVNGMVSELLDRRNKRAEAALKRKLPPADPLPRDTIPTSLHSIARRLSDAQLKLYKEFFPNNSGGINFKAFQFAFELFANGELRDPVKGPGFGEPDGGFYFLFSEFAFLCIDSKIDKTVWAMALKTFVKTQEIFMHIYREPPHAAPPPVGASLPKPGSALRQLDGDPRAGIKGFHFNNFDAGGQSDASRRRKLRAKYDSINISGLRSAARDNLLRALRMP